MGKAQHSNKRKFKTRPLTTLKEFPNNEDCIDGVPKNIKNVIDNHSSSNTIVKEKLVNSDLKALEEEDLIESQSSNLQKFEYNLLRYTMLLSTFAAAVTVLISLYSPSVIIEVPPIEEPIKINVSQKISLLLDSFPKQQADTWKRLSIGIRSIESMAEPAVFFMIQWNENKKGNQETRNTALGIAEAAGMIAAQYLGNVNQTASLIILSEEDMKLSHHGMLVSQYKNELESKHVMIIEKIEKVNGHIAQGLRYICDEHNPLVNRSAIFLILNADGCPGISKNDILEGSTRSLISHSERCLTDLWGGKNGLEPDILMPLLARIINSVIKIIPEEENDEP